MSWLWTTVDLSRWCGFNLYGNDGNYYVGDTKWHSDKDPKDPIESFKIAFYLDPVTRDTGCLPEAPILTEHTPSEEMLPLDEPDEEDIDDEEPGESVH